MRRFITRWRWAPEATDQNAIPPSDPTPRGNPPSCRIAGLLATALVLTSCLSDGLIRTSRSQSPKVVFSDSGGQRGINVVIRSGHATEKKYLVEGMTGGVCLFDYDGDGWLDIYLVNGSSVEAYRQGRRPEMVKNHLF